MTIDRTKLSLHFFFFFGAKTKVNLRAQYMI